MKKIFIGIDIGCTGAKAIAIDEKSNTVAKSSYRYDDSLIITNDGWCDQDPEILLEAAKDCITRIVGETKDDCEVSAVGVTGQMHGMVAIDKDHKPLRSMISCIDFRNFKENDALYDKVGGKEGLLPYTNNRMLPSCTGGKIIWFKENEPELYKKTYKIINPKDYIRMYLTGVPGTDVSDASGFGLLDVKERCWSKKLLEIAGIDEEKLPEVRESGAVVGTVCEACSKELGISQNAVVVAGAGDAIMQTAGAGAVEAGVYGIIIGSGGCITTTLDKYVVNKGATVQMYAAALANKWVSYVGLMSVGTATDWFKNTFYAAEGKENPSEVFDIMEKEAENISPGCDGLLFFPSLMGQRNPVDDPFAKGVLVGLTTNHTRGHLYRALLEGLTIGMRDVYMQLKELAVPVKRLHISGGGAASKLWCQLFADVFNKPVYKIKEFSYCGSYGVARLAALAWIKHNNPSQNTDETSFFCENEYSEIFEPNSERAKIYDAVYDIYKEIYPSNKDLFEKLRVFNEEFGGGS